MVATVGVRRFQTFIELRRHLAASNAESNDPRPLRLATGSRQPMDAALHGLAVSTGLRRDCVFLPKPAGRRRTSRSSRG